jgi:hypothetical protein
MNTMTTYTEKLRDPRWQRKRLEIMQRDNFTCTQCGDTSTTQNVHHWEYVKEPWDAKNADLVTVCETCHKEIEECKKLTKSFLRQADFRDLVSHMHLLLNYYKEGRVVKDDDSVSFLTRRYLMPPIHAGEGYRWLDESDIVLKGDEFFCQITGTWVTYYTPIGKKYIHNDWNNSTQKPGSIGRRRMPTSAVFDHFIHSAPDGPITTLEAPPWKSPTQ